MAPEKKKLACGEQNDNFIIKWRDFLSFSNSVHVSESDSKFNRTIKQNKTKTKSEKKHQNLKSNTFLHPSTPEILQDTLRSYKRLELSAGITYLAGCSG